MESALSTIAYRGGEEGQKKEHRLSGQLDSLAAADILAHDEIFGADHVGTRFGELRPILIIGVRRKLVLLGPYQPANLVIGFLPAVGANEMGWFSLRVLGVEIPLLHRWLLSAPRPQPWLARRQGGTECGTWFPAPRSNKPSSRRHAHPQSTWQCSTRARRLPLSSTAPDPLDRIARRSAADHFPGCRCRYRKWRKRPRNRPG